MTNTTTPTTDTVTFRFFRMNGEEVTGTSNSLEESVLGYRKQLKRRAIRDRAERGSFEYKIGNRDWLRAR